MEQGQRPIPLEDIDSAPYWQAAREHRLDLPCCNDCGSILFPPRPRCPSCLSANLTWIELSGQGQVFSFTVVYVPIVRGIEPPYVVAQIEMAEQPGLRMTANILGCDPESVHIGMPVEVMFEDLGDGCSLPQFRLAGASFASQLIAAKSGGAGNVGAASVAPAKLPTGSPSGIPSGTSSPRPTGRLGRALSAGVIGGAAPCAEIKTGGRAGCTSPSGQSPRSKRRSIRHE